MGNARRVDRLAKDSGCILRSARPPLRRPRTAIIQFSMLINSGDTATDPFKGPQSHHWARAGHLGFSSQMHAATPTGQPVTEATLAPSLAFSESLSAFVTWVLAFSSFSGPLAPSDASPRLPWDSAGFFFLFCLLLLLSRPRHWRSLGFGPWGLDSTLRGRSRPVLLLGLGFVRAPWHGSGGGRGRGRRSHGACLWSWTSSSGMHPMRSSSNLASAGWLALAWPGLPWLACI